MFLLHHPKETWEPRDNLPHNNIDSCEEIYYKTLKQPANVHLEVSHQGQPSTVGNMSLFCRLYYSILSILLDISRLIYLKVNPNPTLK